MCVCLFRAIIARPTSTTRSSFCSRFCRSPTSRPAEPQLDLNQNRNPNRLRQTDLLALCVSRSCGCACVSFRDRLHKVQCSASLCMYQFWIRSIRVGGNLEELIIFNTSARRNNRLLYCEISYCTDKRRRKGLYNV